MKKILAIIAICASAGLMQASSKQVTMQDISKKVQYLKPGQSISVGKNQEVNLERFIKYQVKDGTARRTFEYGHVGQHEVTCQFYKKLVWLAPCTDRPGEVKVWRTEEDRRKLAKQCGVYNAFDHTTLWSINLQANRHGVRFKKAQHLGEIVEDAELRVRVLNTTVPPRESGEKRGCHGASAGSFEKRKR